MLVLVCTYQLIVVGIAIREVHTNYLYEEMSVKLYTSYAFYSSIYRH